MLPDYYQILGINSFATNDEIKKAYRLLAKKYHPDINKSKEANKIMQDIIEAYTILKDTEARDRYNAEYYRLYTNTKEEYTMGKRENRPKGNTYQQETKIDPILEKWILNARKQAAEFVYNAKGIAKSGCRYYVYGLCLCLLLFIIVLVIINIYRVVH